jgi:NhaP-type Na+/H+ or K+/H+ antiporter
MTQGVTLLLAALLGAVAGPVLGVGQWWVLRRHVAHAWRWIPAQSLAWAAGMPIIFQMVDWIAPGAFTLRDAFVAAAMLFLAGAVVGAIHGPVMARLLNERT